jgi:2-oxoglutarate ferredoxin oxidoreductase subunit beta
MEHKGFSFVQALSPCPTFRPEQMQWKQHVRVFDEETSSDPVEAAQRIQADDGMSTGIIFSNEYPVFRPGTGIDRGMGNIESEFTI